MTSSILRPIFHVGVGLEELLHPGDIVIQNGTRHRWINRGDTDAVWAAFVVGVNAGYADASTM